MLAGLPGFVKDPDPSIYESNNYVIFDFETTNVLKGSPLADDNRIVLACWKTGHSGSVHHSFASEFEQAELVAACEAADFIVAHNAKFDMGWLRRCGIDLRKVVCFDTMLAEYVLGGNKYSLRQLSLNACCERRGLPQKEGLVSYLIKLGICPSTIPQSWLLKYCEADVVLAEELFLRLRDELSEKLRAIVYARCLVTPCLADIEFNGMNLDEETVESLYKEMEDEYARATAELQDFCEGIPPSANKQVAVYVYESLGFDIPKDAKGKPMRTEGGDYSVAAKVMERLRAKTDRQHEYLRLRNVWIQYHSDVTKYLRKFRQCCQEAGGYLRGVINQGNTRTHRFSSTGLEYRVQLQNFNRRFKPLFVARKHGWKVGEGDGAQLEFRVAVHSGRDVVGLADLRDGVDVHAMSSRILEVDRQDAKEHTFKPLYGGQSGTAKQREYYAAFAERYRGITKWQRRNINHVLRTKELETEYGLIFYFPTTVMKRSGYVTNTTNICNYPVQGLATAEIIPMALVCAWHRMVDMQSFLINSVHDSIVGEIHPDEEELWHEVCRQCLIDDVYEIMEKLYNVRLTVPLGAGVVIADHWGGKDETKYEAAEELYLDAAKEAGML